MTKVIKRGDYVALATRASASFYTTDSFRKHPFSHTHYSSLSSRLSTINNPHKSSTRSRNKQTSFPTASNTSNVDSFHFSYLRTKLQTNPEYQCLTDRTNIFLTTDSTQHSRKLSLSQTTGKHSTSKIKHPLTGLSLTHTNNNKHLRYHYIPIPTTPATPFIVNAGRNESVSQFLSKTTALARFKYLHVIQQEKQTQYIESQETQVLENAMSVHSLLSTKQLLDEYRANLHAYVKYLHNEIEANKQELKQYTNTIHNLVREIKRLNQMILKCRNEISFYKTYKTFFLCVKHKVLNINHLPVETLVHYHLILPRPPQRKSIFTKRTSHQHQHISAATSTQHVIPNEEEEAIFASLDDFERCFHDIETNTMKLFTLHNALTNEIKLLKRTRAHIEEEKASDSVVHSHEEKRLTMKLHSVKVYNTNLKTHVAQLERYGMSIANSKKKVLNKLVDVLWSLPFDLEKEFDCKGVYKLMKTKGDAVCASASGMKVNAVLFYLSVVERVVVHVLQKHRMLLAKGKQTIDVGKIKGVIDMKKRLLNSKEKIRNEQLRRERMPQKMRQIPKFFTKP